jgi:arginine utilization protein RocB
MEAWYSQTRALALEMTRSFSQTDTPGETQFGPFLRDLLSKMPYFQAHPEHLRLETTALDPIERSAVLALVKGSGSGTIILTGHYDVVGIENYGPLAEWACDPDALLPRLIAALEAEEAHSQPAGLSPSDRLALDDLRSGDFLPGRGLLDMKGGLAAGLAVLEKFSQLPEARRKGNLLFMAVPDEEIASHGARTAAGLLPALAQEWGLEFAAAINLDASVDSGDGSQGRMAYLGSVGKLLPSVYLVGRETHAGSPFNGVNATLLASELTRRIECNPAFSDRLGELFTVPPTCLKQADTKSHYDVTTPTTAWCYYNWLTLRQPIETILDRLAKTAQQALDAAMASLHASAERYAAAFGGPVPALDWKPRVYRYTEVRAAALQRGGAAVRERLETLERDLSADPSLDTPTCCLRLTEAAWAESGLSGPAAVIGVAAIYYPPACLTSADGSSSPRAAALERAIHTQIETFAAQGVSIRTAPYFPGISDLSFLGGQVPPEEMDALSANTPAWNGRAGFSPAALNLPAVNIGPWGRDYHHRLERIHAPYSFEILPALLWGLCSDLLGFDR